MASEKQFEFEGYKKGNLEDDVDMQIGIIRTFFKTIGKYNPQ